MTFPCKECGARTLVIDSRPASDDNGSAIIRRRQCGKGHRFSTYELAAQPKPGQRRGSIVNAVDAHKATEIRDLRARLAQLEGSQ